MNRWIPTALLGLVLAAPAILAQGFVREAPKDVRPAIIAVSATPPIITVDGKEDRLSPGARVRDRNNMLVLTGGLAGKEFYTVYKRDGGGLVHEVWLLNEQEYAKLGGRGGSGEAVRFINEMLALIWGARINAQKQ